MGLPVRQRRVLDRIENALRGSDPRLAGLYSLFARLHRGEEMPRLEQLRHGLVVVIARVRLRLALILRRVVRRAMPRQPALLFFPLTLAVIAVSIFFAVRAGPGRGCPPTSPFAASTHRPPGNKACKTNVVNPFETAH